MIDPVSIAAEGATQGGWNRGVSRRFISLAVARGLTQVISLVWFLVAARNMSEFDFGQVATGLAFFAVFAGLGDLGTTRTVVRFVAADNATLWPAFTRTVRLRVLGGVTVGLVGTVLILILPVPVDPVIVLLAGAIAVVSGLTELGYAALRSVGKTAVEMVLLPAENTMFLVVGSLLVVHGQGAIAILVTYLATNGLSALVVGVAVFRARPAHARHPGGVLDREARFTAVAFALLNVSPRIAPVLLALLASATAVARFSVAQRPVEVMTLFALSTAAPMLPILRGHTARGQRPHAERATSAVTAAIVVALVPVTVLFMVSPEVVLSALFGGNRYDDARVALSLLAVTAITWSVRGVGELLLLAEERARRSMVIMLTGVAISIALGVPLVLRWSVNGAAVSLVASEIVMSVLMVVALPRLVEAASLRRFVPAVVIAVMAAGALALAPKTLPWSIAIIGPLILIALACSLRLVRHLDVIAS